MWSRPDRFANKEEEKNLSWEVPKQRAVLIKANSISFDHHVLLGYVHTGTQRDFYIFLLQLEKFFRLHDSGSIKYPVKWEQKAG